MSKFNVNSLGLSNAGNMKRKTCIIISSESRRESTTPCAKTASFIDRCYLWPKEKKNGGRGMVRRRRIFDYM